MLDVIIAGAGPAGSIAALILARAGARVLLVDRDAFPRDKLCGDTLNPGAIAFLRSLGLTGGPLDGARPLAGMLVSSQRLGVRGIYGGGITGFALTRRELDVWLLEQAVGAGARFESGWVVRRPLVEDTRGHSLVRGLALESRRERGTGSRMPAVMTIAADGSRSTVGRALGLVTFPHRHRRWAFGVYATGIAETSDVGEMHVRSGVYLGIAPLSDVLANVCVVTGPRPAGPTPLDVIRRAIAQDARLAARFTHAAFVGKVRVLGPLATDVRMPGTDGLLLAGDAAGFVDPITGDGLHLAMRGAVLAAEEALRTLETGDVRGAAWRLAEARRDAFGAKVRFNRTVRRIVGSSVAVEIASLGAAVVPGVMRRVVRYAGDSTATPRP
jgi:flavin-dependent dehydrogenase